MKLPCLLLATAVALAASAFAGPIEEAETVVREGIDKVLGVTAHSQGGPAMTAQLRPIIETHVDFATMTRRAVGPGWKQFTPAQQSEAIALFTKLIIRSYSKGFTPGEQPQMKLLKSNSPAPDKVEVPTTMLYKGSRYGVTYRVENAGKWLVTDMQVENVSLVANYRAQFDELFKEGGASAVIASLKESVAQ